MGIPKYTGSDAELRLPLRHDSGVHLEARLTRLDPT